MSHGRAVWVMVTAAMLWSIAGVVARHLQAAQGFEVTFWRSAGNAVSLVVLLVWLRGGGTLWRAVRHGGRTLWLSGLCWSVMFTAFMMAITLTTVANVLVTMAISPLLTALLAWMALGHRLPARTWGAIVAAGAGIAWMYAGELRTGDARHWAGIGVALGVPVAAAINWTLLQHEKARSGDGPGTDYMPAVLIGATLSALFTLGPSLPFDATPRDIAMLTTLGLVQLAIPCLMAVAAARVLSAPEMALLGLLEVIFGVLWAWLGAGETPAGAVLVGGALVLGALVANELLGVRARRLG
ncbi:DMT family transporter [Rubrivivax albus]|uniref:DMT family transporter n=1 Tax=Rubrivivax albus TaxID=2499835 RepID=A0A3S2VTL6_9BURK|nr:DMT family transporter [Rubrivivax albus]RVT48367.1 DMT family transporter [Rubrivivax albus]